MNLRNLLLGAVLLATGTITSHAQQKVKLEIFYETLNEVPAKFFLQQFRLVSEKLSDRLDLRLFPYGNTVLAGNVYTCPYGEQQCVANKLHACFVSAEITQQPPTGIDEPVNQAAVSRFANCFFKNRFSDVDLFVLAKKCQSSAGIGADWAQLHSCVLEADNRLTDQLKAISDRVATELREDGLVVRIDGTFHPGAKTNLLGAICSTLGETLPAICANSATPPSMVKIGIYFESQNRVAYNYLVSQLSAWHHVLEDMTELDIIPYGNTQFLGDDYNCTSEDKCILNKFIALVVYDYLTTPKNGDLVSGARRVINFLTCLAKSTRANFFSQVEECVNEKLQDSGEYTAYLLAIKSNDPKVSKIMQENRLKTEAITNSPGLPRVPTITVNGDINYNAFNDLVSEICAKYGGPITAAICSKVQVTVLYEPLNHKSRTLFLQQLQPIFASLYNVIDLKMLPVGRALLAPGQGFVCRAGADQCNAMMLQVCAIDYFWNDGYNYKDPIRLEVFDFIACTFKNKKFPNVMNASEYCSGEMKSDAWDTIHGCFTDGTGNGIFDEYIQEVQSLYFDIPNAPIPHVIINDNVGIADFTQIKSTICAFYDEYHSPDYCLEEMPAKVEISVFYESMSVLSGSFLNRQYYPYYMDLETMANIRLYPAGNVRESENGNSGKCDSIEMNSACMGNKLQALIIDQYNLRDDEGDALDGRLRVMMFLRCVFEHPNYRDNIYLAYEVCTEETLPLDNWYNILHTTKSERGTAVYKQVLDLTEKLKKDNGLTEITTVPWVTLDNLKHSKQAANELLKTICSQYTGFKPLECTSVQVEIYYTSVHPASRRFFLDQFIPVYRNLRERIDIKLIPYGLVDGNSNLDDECAKNKKACDGNMLQACAIVRFFRDELQDTTIQWDGKNQTISFVYCVFKNVKRNGDIWALSEECANENFGIFTDEVSQCAHDLEGEELLEANRQLTASQFETMEHAPWIVVNGLRSALAQSDLKTTVCNAMLGDRPDFCYVETPAKVKLEFHYSSLDAKSQHYFQNELYPVLRELEDILEVDPVPFGLTQVLTQADGNYTLICENGENECIGNLIHVCLYSLYFHADDNAPVTEYVEEFNGKLLFFKFLQCYFTSAKYPTENLGAAYECGANIFGDGYSSARECAYAPMGRNLLVQLQEKKVSTLRPPLKYLPWMTLNGKHSYTLKHHIQRTVCDTFTGKEKPHDCYVTYDSQPKPIVEIHYSPGDTGSVQFFTSSLSNHVPEISQVSLVPFGRSTWTETIKSCVGDADCVQHKEHACLIDAYLTEHPMETVSAICCTFGEHMNDHDVVNECVNQNFQDILPDAYLPIAECFSSGRADALMKANALLVSNLMPKISYVPWVTLNGKPNIEAEVSLFNELCATYYPKDKPSLCHSDLLPVSIYYETKNQDVSGLMLGQLSLYTPYLDELGSFQFIPYGTTNVSNGVFTCSVDEDQCAANKVHACVISQYYNQSAVVNLDYEANRMRFAAFLVCSFSRQMNSSDAVDNAEVCLSLNFEGDLWRDIHLCARGPEGDDLMTEMGRQTDALVPKFDSAPYVTIGGQKNEKARTHLMDALCNSYVMVRPALCATLPTHAVPIKIYFSGNAQGQKYFKEQLAPFYSEIFRDGTEESQQLHAIISPEAIAWGNTVYDPTNTENPFTCEGGANECFINRFFTCAYHYHGTEPRAARHLMQFHLCFWSDDEALTNPAGVFNKCTKRVWIPDPFPQLEACATEASQPAYDIFLAAKAKTENNYPALTFFPTVTVNNRYDEFTQGNLLAGVCYHYTGYNPPTICAEQVTPTTTLPPTDPTATGSMATGPTVTGPTTTAPTVTPTTPPTGPGATPVMYLFVLISFLLSFLLLISLLMREPTFNNHD